MTFRLAIHWYRRDLRISDNTALHEASRAAGAVLPVYILSDWKDHHAWTGSGRQAFLCRSLASLAGNLETLGGRLILRSGRADEVLEALLRETGAEAIYYNRDPDPFGRAMEEKVEAMARRLGAACRACDDVALHHPAEVLTKDARPYRVFTPYFNNWRALEKPHPLPKPGRLNTPPGISSLPLPTPAWWNLPEPSAPLTDAGEKAAWGRLRTAVVDRLPTYATARDFPARDGTTRLSQDLRWGLLSPRTIFAKASGAAGGEKFIQELAWREFHLAILWHFPEVLREEFQPEWRGLPWRGPGRRFDAWKSGRTGFPIVDAGMHELLATGHMHNRVRMISAMFLTKDLHIDWRLGERYFLRHLVDGEIASNNGGWQWCAGTGADAAPYFRIQNPWTQAKRYDPDGSYIRRWLPELAGVPTAKFFAPPESGSALAPDYPLPCVDHATERARTLEMFQRHKGRRR